MRTVVVTGASRGLGLASAVRLYEDGWHVVAAMRSPDTGLKTIQQRTGADDEDPRLTGIRLDLTDPASISAAARSIEQAIGTPDAIVHNAGIAGVGAVEEVPDEFWRKIFATSLFGPVQLTRELLPAMRAAGRGRIVVVASQGGQRGMPAVAAYSAAKAATERWAESMAGEVAPFGIGVSVLVTGMFDTEILTEAGLSDFGDQDGPYGPHHRRVRRRQGLFKKLANPPERFARALVATLDDQKPFARHAVGLDAHLILLGVRVMPAALMHTVVRSVMGLPRANSLKEHR